MAGNTFGTLFRLTTFGESHGAAIGAVIDGCPAGLPLSEENIQPYLDRRRPGDSPFSTARREGDCCRILSGVFEGKTTGTPIAVLIENTDQRSQDYAATATCYRPGHADFGYDRKYGFRDYRGGGRSSGRETAGRVIGGAVAATVLRELGMEVSAWTESIGPVSVAQEKTDLSLCGKNPFWMPDAEAAARAEKYLIEQKQALDSAGGIIACRVTGVPAGLGEPVFDKLDAELAKAVVSIGAVKGIQFGSGFAAAGMSGSQSNDSFRMSEDGRTVQKESNHAGGVLGGMSDGSEIFFTVAVKPTPSIAQRQRTITNDGKNTEIEIHGRHDPVIVPRAIVVVESMASLVLLDMLMRNIPCRMDTLRAVCNR